MTSCSDMGQNPRQDEQAITRKIFKLLYGQGYESLSCKSIFISILRSMNCSVDKAVTIESCILGLWTTSRELSNI